MLQAPGADVEQGQDDQGEPGAAVVTAQAPERVAQTPDQLDPAEIPPEQLQAAVGSQRLGHELNREITLDHPPQAGYAQAHQMGLQREGSDVATFSLKTALGASLIHSGRPIMPRLFAV